MKQLFVHGTGAFTSVGTHVGMTAGSLIVYFNPTFFAPERLFANVIWITAAFAVAVVLSTTMLISTVVIDPATGFLLAVLLWGKVIAALVPPYVFAGMAISLALTRSPWQVGLVYGADLAGANGTRLHGIRGTCQRRRHAATLRRLVSAADFLLL